MITKERLDELFEFDEVRAVFIYREKFGPNKNKKHGFVMGSDKPDGYRQACIDKKRYCMHRLVWLHYHGQMPEMDIDHINGDRKDNRIENLRLASRELNAENKRLPTASNKSGYLGVSWEKRSSKWHAQIHHKGKCIYIGLFDCPAEAHQAYLEAKRRLHAGCTI